MKQLIITFLFLTTMGGCAASRVFTRDEALQATQHTYSGVSKEDLIKSAEKVLDLADGSDVTFADNRNGFIASRNWLVYAVLAATRGTDTWAFTVEEKKDGLLASVQVSTNAGSIMATGSSAAGVVTTPNMGSIVQGTALYDMFWERLDYLLGRRKDWADCKRGLGKIKKKETWGDLDQICDSVTLKDSFPDNLSDAEVERLFPNEPNDPRDIGRAFQNNPNDSKKKQYLKRRNPNHM